MTFFLPTSSPIKASAGGQEEQPWDVKSSTRTGLKLAVARAGTESPQRAAAPRPNAARRLRQGESIKTVWRKGRSSRTHFVVNFSGRRYAALARLRSTKGKMPP